MERSCLKAADHLTYISGPMLPKAEQIANIQLSDKATLISNGFDEKLLDNITRTNKALNGRQMKLGYFGAVDHGEQSYRDPATVFKTLEKLPENKVQFVIHGPSKLEAGWEQRLGSRLMNGGKLTHLEAIQRMFEMDALVLLHTREEGADEVITGKVFEYISTGLPIISIGPKTMAVNQLLRDDPTFFSVDHRDEAHLLATIEKLHGQSLGGPVRRAESIIKAFSRTTQHEKFIQLLKVKEGNCE
ncbi:hypothetical protein C1O66_09690 [Paucibacter aquatile]|uniref:Glycosyl transferase family 1 domain-containing protein n=2 Tax=Kinneretia aquatilis TaxID=2070761 RepID=A0A2N8KWF5_9BURK|nr:hypothetical protein C1O66_09690 [Paucibacter aquatile]